MSTDFRGLVPASNDPLLQIFVALQKKFAKFITTQQVDLIDSDNEDIYSDGQDMDTVIKYHSLNHEQLFSFDKKFYPTFEPDGQYVTLYLKGRSMGNTLKDWSGFNNTAEIHGDPILVPSDFDPGTYTYGTKSTALRFNRTGGEFENNEWLQVPDAANLRVSSLSTGFSMFFRFQLYNIDNQNGRSRTLFQKIDDATPDNATMLQVKSDGRLVFIVIDGGVTTAKETGAALTPPFSVYDVFVTYTVSGSVLHIYVNGVDQTLNDFTGDINWQTSTTDYDLYIYQRGAGSDAGFANGDMFIIKRYQEMIVSQTQVTNHWNNKITISPHEYGTSMITNYWATFRGAIPPLPGLCSFSSISFSPESFNICDVGAPPATVDSSFEDDSFEDDSFEV